MRDFIFDLDDTLVNTDKSFELYPGVKGILLTIHKLGHRLFICSHNNQALKILQMHDIDQLFTGMSAWCRKVPALKAPNLMELVDQYHLQLCNLVFFDDMFENVTEIQALGVESVLVDDQTGVTMEDVKPFL